MIDSNVAAMIGLPQNLPAPSPPAGSGAARLAGELVPPPASRDIVRPVVTYRDASGRELAMGSFEAADRFNNVTALWCSPIKSADGDIIHAKKELDGKSRDMLRNDAYVQGGSNLHKDNIVGSHYLLNAAPATSILGLDDTWEEEFQAEVEEKFDLWGESPDNWPDISRHNRFTDLVRMAVGVHLAGGEVLATVEWDRNGGSEFNTAIQMIDLDRLSTSPESMGDPDVVMGVRKDRFGAAVAYQIQTAHPADVRFRFALPEWKEIPVRKPWGRLQVIHLHEQIRPDQTRGISEMASSLTAMKIGHRTRDLNLQRLATQAMYAAAITSDMPSDQIFAALGGTNFTSTQVEKMVTEYATGYLQSIAQYAGGAKNLQIDGVKIPHLYPGTKLDLLSPGKDSFPVAEFEQSLLRYIASSIGVSYEQLSRDYTNTNYSSARAAMTETWKFMQARKKLIADKFAHIIYRLWLEEAINNNRITTFPVKKAGLLYTNGRLNLNFDAISRANWIGASRGQIDELKETQAAVLRMQNGLSTAEDELARLGKDWRKVYRQIKREQALRETLGIVMVGTGQIAADSAANDSPSQQKKAA